MNPPTPVLSADKIYEAYDSFVCKECAGMTAEYTGVTIGGYRLTAVTAADVVEWAGYNLGPLTCSCHRLEGVLDEQQQLLVRPVAPLQTPAITEPPAQTSPASRAIDETRFGVSATAGALVMCQCEHIDHEHPATAHPYLGARAGTRRALHVGLVCDECATGHLADYLLDDGGEDQPR